MKYFLVAILAVAVFCGQASAQVSSAVLEANKLVDEARCQWQHLLDTVAKVDPDYAYDKVGFQGVNDYSSPLRYQRLFEVGKLDERLYIGDAKRHSTVFLKDLNTMINMFIGRDHPEAVQETYESATIKCTLKSTAILYGLE